MESDRRESGHGSDQGGNRVGIAEFPDAAVAVRDSKTPTGPVLALAPAAFTELLSWTAAGAE